MQQSEVLEGLKGYVANEILDGKDIGLDGATPLLEWGILNSMEMVRLVGFIESRFKVEVPDHLILPEHFQNLTVLSDLIIDLG